MRRLFISLAALPLLAFGGTTTVSGSVSHAGSWKGLTGQHKVILFHVTARNKIDTATATMKIPFQNCGGNVTFTTKADLDPPVAIRHAKFHFRAGSNPRVSVTGHFSSATRASGSMTGTFSDPVSGCMGKKTTSWTARKRSSR